MRAIARAAGVSPATVAFVLNNRMDMAVAPETRERVHKIANELGYQQHRLARTIKSPLKHIGLVFGDLAFAQQSFTGPILVGAQRAALAGGYRPVLQTAPSFKEEPNPRRAAATLIELSRSRLLDGLILDKQYFLTDTVLHLVAAKVPLVMVNGGQVVDKRGRPVPSVTIDDTLGGKLAAMHLLELGHRRAAIVSRPFETGRHAMRSTPVVKFTDGALNTFKAEGGTIAPDWICEGDFEDTTLAKAIITRIMSARQPPTAFIVGDDIIAMMIVQALQRAGYTVPEDVSVIGYGGWSLFGRVFEPRLTTVRVPLEDNGAVATELLIKNLSGLNNVQITLKPEMSPGLTTAKAPRPL